MTAGQEAWDSGHPEAAAQAHSHKLHELRTPLNQIIGLSEMLLEMQNSN